MFFSKRRGQTHEWGREDIWSFAVKYRNGTLQIAATELANLSACDHLISLEVEALRDARTRPNTYSAVTMRLAHLGQQHEDRHLQQLKDGGHAVAELVDIQSEEDAAALTLQAMRDGVDVVYQGALRGDGWFGRTDFLVRVPVPSRFGAYSYEVVDTKLSRETKGRALIQLCMYSQLLAEAQRVLPEAMHIVLGDGREEHFQTRNYLAYFRRLRSEVRGKVSASQPATYPVPIAQCDVCPWQDGCEKQLRDDDDLSLVAGLTTRQRERLLQAGVPTLRRLSLLHSTQSVEGISPAALERIREQARVQARGRDEGRMVYELLPETDDNRGLLTLPEPSPGDLFVDIEGDPLVMDGGIEYLIGVTESGPVCGRYKAFWGTNRATEKTAFEAFMAFVRERRVLDPSLHIYHYAAYEPAALKRLAARHNTCEEEVDALVRGRVFVDLCRAVRQGLRASVESYSIKNLESLYGFSRKADLRDAGSCLVAMATWFDRRQVGEPPTELKSTIAAYNEDDCASALALRHWLEARRRELEGKHGAPLPRPAPGDAASAGLAMRITEVDQMERRLLNGIPDDERERTPSQHGQWILAQLLDWHRREDKSAWWEFHRQCDLSDEELVADPAPLGGLLHEGDVGKEKLSRLHQYRYPPQEHGIAFARTLVDPRSGESAGTLHKLDEATRTIILKRGPKLSRAQHPLALVAKDIVDTRVLRERLMSIGKWVAEHGIDSKIPEFVTERALLKREPPRFPVGLELVVPSTGEQTTELGIKLALAIDGSVLPVQGPPGAGKTFLGAQMINSFVAAGKRVGILANSHKVIGKLLEEACKAAERSGRTLRCVQKIDEPRPTHTFVEQVEDNDDLDAAVASGAQVIAGTSWLWARDAMKQKVDVLFVDEAGQISLANVVAAAHASNGLVLLGDPQQLEQPIKGVHPPGVDVSALGYMLGGKVTLDPRSGIFLAETWRMHPSVCSYISEVFYESKLHARSHLAIQEVHASGVFGGRGMRFVAVDHRGNTNESPEEAMHIGKLVAELLASGATWTNEKAATQRITAADVLVITPYNAQVAALKKQLPADVMVGTVDKFQGQEAPIAIYSLATSSPEEAPRGMEFLYSKNRLNVALSRARCVSVVVGNPALFRVQCKTPRQMELANAFCRLLEIAAVDGAPIGARKSTPSTRPRSFIEELR